MISQEKRLIITFRCTTDAIAMEKSCKATGAPGRLDSCSKKYLCQLRTFLVCAPHKPHCP